MKKENNKEFYNEPEIEIHYLSIETSLAVSQTEPIDDDSEEHPWS